MRRIARTGLVLSIAVAIVPISPASAEDGAKPAGPDHVGWPQFRGRQASGVQEGPAVPETWDIKTGENIRWKVELPGLGVSSPVVWADRILLTTAVSAEAKPELKVGLYGDINPIDDDAEHKWQVICLDRSTGKTLWTQTAHEGKPAIKRHPKGSHANSTPATDGEHIVAFFGSEGLYCYDMDGKLLWSKNFGVLDSGFFMSQAAQWGFGSSPVIHDGKVIIQVDVQKDSFLAALDVKDGKELWKTPRNEVPTWSSPTVHVTPERSQVICNGFKIAAGYDLETGSELWRIEGGGDIPVPTPVIYQDLTFLTSAHGMFAPVYAVKLDATGNISPKDGKGNASLPWYSMRNGNYMQTPLVYGDHLFTCSDMGIFRCYDARTGERKVQERLSKTGMGGFGYTASLVANAGRIFATSEDGKVHVLKAGPEFERLAINDLDESCMATPAISDGVLFVRGQTHLFAIGAKP